MKSKIIFYLKIETVSLVVPVVVLLLFPSINYLGFLNGWLCCGFYMATKDGVKHYLLNRGK